MLAFIRKWCQRKPPVKNFSTTMTTADQGTDSQKELSPDIASLLKSIKKKENITNEDLNKLSGYFFNQPTIKPGVYNLHKAVIDSMCFEISAVNPVYDTKGDVANIYLELREMTYNNEFAITVSVKDFHEVFNHLTFKPIPQKS